MILQIQANSSITIQGMGHYPSGSYTTGQWVNLAPMLALGTMEATTNAVDGPNAGRSIDNGYMIRDLLGYKEKVPVVTVPLLLADAQALRQLVKGESVNVRTDIFEGALTTYEMYCGATLTMTHVITKPGGVALYKIAFNLIEL